MSKFPFYKQHDFMDCGPTCLRMIAKHYGQTISITTLRKLANTTRTGTSLKNLSVAAEKIGFRTLGVQLNFDDLRTEISLPCIAYWNQTHFVVVYKIEGDTVYVADPAYNLLEYSVEKFLAGWIGNNATEEDTGILLIVEPTPELFQSEYDDEDNGRKRGFKYLFQYALNYKKFLFQLLIGILGGSIIQFIFPFLTQSIVDIGIQNQNLNFVYLILIAQLFLFLGQIGIEIIRGWILLHLSTRINISLISDFFIKLMRLPISFFDVKMTGDIMQRIEDHRRIETLLTTSSLDVLFSMVNILLFGVVLLWYNLSIFLVYLAGSILYVLWIVIFLKRRKDLDYKRFAQLSAEQSKVIELINGMQEIKLHNAEQQKRWGWEFLQARLFKIEVKNLALEQTQTVGSGFINELKNILISFLAAKLVIEGAITLGMMMSISYIIGQLNLPLQRMISFVYSVQNAQIALERLSEIHDKEDEEPLEKEIITEIPKTPGLSLSNLSFKYKDSDQLILKDLNLEIPGGKMTAIVGASGSGKTTLMKLLLKFYEPEAGNIKVNNLSLGNIGHKVWRERCGVVMQEGFIFNDTISGNIALGEDYVDHERLTGAVDIANIQEFIEQMPLTYNTKIGQDGVGMSTGQKQRIFIARAVYKNPEIIFFDEATSALDAKNERIIIEKLNRFFKGRTAVVIAHRLSTVRNADQIVVLDEGKVAEKGTHEELVNKRGVYYKLIKNQLELENLGNG